MRFLFGKTFRGFVIFYVMVFTIVFSFVRADNAISKELDLNLYIIEDQDFSELVIDTYDKEKYKIEEVKFLDLNSGIEVKASLVNEKFFMYEKLKNGKEYSFQAKLVNNKTGERALYKSRFKYLQSKINVKNITVNSCDLFVNYNRKNLIFIDKIDVYGKVSSSKDGDYDFLLRKGALELENYKDKVEFNDVSLKPSTNYDIYCSVKINNNVNIVSKRKIRSKGMKISELKSSMVSDRKIKLEWDITNKNLKFLENDSIKIYIKEYGYWNYPQTPNLKITKDNVYSAIINLEKVYPEYEIKLVYNLSGVEIIKTIKQINDFHKLNSKITVSKLRDLNIKFGFDNKFNFKNGEILNIYLIDKVNGEASRKKIFSKKISSIEFKPQYNFKFNDLKPGNTYKILYEILYKDGTVMKLKEGEFTTSEFEIKNLNVSGNVDKQNNLKVNLNWSLTEPKFKFLDGDSLSIYIKEKGSSDYSNKPYFYKNSELDGNFSIDIDVQKEVQGSYDIKLVYNVGGKEYSKFQEIYLNSKRENNKNFSSNLLTDKADSSNEKKGFYVGLRESRANDAILELLYAENFTFNDGDILQIYVSEKNGKSTNEKLHSEYKHSTSGKDKLDLRSMKLVKVNNLVPDKKYEFKLNLKTKNTINDNEKVKEVPDNKIDGEDYIDPPSNGGASDDKEEEENKPEDGGSSGGNESDKDDEQDSGSNSEGSGGSDSGTEGDSGTAPGGGSGSEGDGEKEEEDTEGSGGGTSDGSNPESGSGGSTEGETDSNTGGETPGSGSEGDTDTEDGEDSKNDINSSDKESPEDKNNQSNSEDASNPEGKYKKSSSSDSGLNTKNKDIDVETKKFEIKTFTTKEIRTNSATFEWTVEPETVKVFNDNDKLEIFVKRAISTGYPPGNSFEVTGKDIKGVFTGEALVKYMETEYDAKLVYTISGVKYEKTVKFTTKKGTTSCKVRDISEVSAVLDIVYPEGYKFFEEDSVEIYMKEQGQKSFGPAPLFKLYHGDGLSLEEMKSFNLTYLKPKMVYDILVKFINKSGANDIPDATTQFLTSALILQNCRIDSMNGEKLRVKTDVKNKIDVFNEMEIYLDVFYKLADKVEYNSKSIFSTGKNLLDFEFDLPDVSKDCDFLISFNPHGFFNETLFLEFELPYRTIRAVVDETLIEDEKGKRNSYDLKWAYPEQVNFSEKDRINIYLKEITENVEGESGNKVKDILGYNKIHTLDPSVEQTTSFNLDYFINEDKKYEFLIEAVSDTFKAGIGTVELSVGKIILEEKKDEEINFDVPISVEDYEGVGDTFKFNFPELEKIDISEETNFTCDIEGLSVEFDEDGISVRGLVPGKEYPIIEVRIEVDSEKELILNIENIKLEAEDGSQKFLYDVYQRSFLRDPDEVGYQYWINRLKTKDISARDFLINLLFAEREFSDMKYSTEKFIEVLYSIIVDRDPDKEGLDFWINFYNQEAIKNSNGDLFVAKRYTVERMINEEEFKKLILKLNLKY